MISSPIAEIFVCYRHAGLSLPLFWPLSPLHPVCAWFHPSFFHPPASLSWFLSFCLCLRLRCLCCHLPLLCYRLCLLFLFFCLCLRRLCCHLPLLCYRLWLL